MKKLMENDIFLRVISLFIALLCWIYVVFITNPDIEVKISGVPVTLADHQTIKNEGYVVSTDINMTVDIKVKGTRQRLASLDRESIFAYVDLSDCVGKKTYELPINVKLPYEDIKLVNKSVQKVSVSVDNYITREFPVDYAYKGELKAKNYFIKETKLLTSKVSVSGPESIIKTVEKSTVFIDISGASDDISGFAAVQFFNSNNDVIVSKNLDVKTKDISYKCVVYQKKNVEVLPVIKNADGETYKCTITDHPKVTLDGPSSDIDAITTISTEPFYVNDETLPETYTAKLIVPERAVVEEEVDSVNVLVEKLVEKNDEENN